MVSKKRIHYMYLCEDRIGKFITLDYRLSHSASLMMPNGEPWNGVFLFHSHTHHDIFLYSKAIVRCWKFLEALHLGGGGGGGGLCWKAVNKYFGSALFMKIKTIFN